MRSTVEIKGLLDSVVGNGPDKVSATVWKHTKGCAADRISGPINAAACKPVNDLRIENGKALERERIVADVGKLEAARSAVVTLIAASGGEKPVPSRSRAFADILGLFGLNATNVEAIMGKVDRLIITIFFEVSSIFALDFALAPLLAPSPVRRRREPEAPVVAPAAIEAPAPTPPRGSRRRHRSTADRAELLPGGRRGRKADPVVLSFATAFREKNGRSPTGSELLAEFPELPKSTAYDAARRIA